LYSAKSEIERAADRAIETLRTSIVFEAIVLTVRFGRGSTERIW
jgi:hypothetical protein